MRTLRAITCALLLAGLGSTAGADTVQEVFICTLKDGKTMKDLMKVVDEWQSVITSMKSGGPYEAWLLTPIAADDLSSVVWVGQTPDMVSFGKLTDEYDASKAGQEITAKFQRVVDCDSRSLWRSKQVR
jgi:hypothetical protein